MIGKNSVKHHYLKSKIFTPKDGWYYWCRLQIHKKSMSRLWNKKFKWITWFVCSKWYITASCYIEQFLEYVSWNILVSFCSFCFCTKISMASSLKNTKVKLDLLTDTDMLLLVKKKVYVAEYLFIDMWKIITNS